MDNPKIQLTFEATIQQLEAPYNSKSRFSLPKLYCICHCCSLSLLIGENLLQMGPLLMELHEWSCTDWDIALYLWFRFVRVHLSGKEISLAGFIKAAKKMDCYGRVNSWAAFKVCYSFFVVFSCETL